MSEQISGTHGRAEDDSMKRQDRQELQAQREEWPAQDLAGEDEQSTAIWAPEGRFAGTPAGDDWQTIELRSDLARHLDAKSFPATRGDLVRTLSSRQADQRLLDLVQPIPADARIANLGQLLRVVGLPMEER